MMLAVSRPAEDAIERFALARKRLAIRPGGRDEAIEMNAAYDGLLGHIAGLEATIAALTGDADVAA